MMQAYINHLSFQICSVAGQLIPCRSIFLMVGKGFVPFTAYVVIKLIGQKSRCSENHISLTINYSTVQATVSMSDALHWLT